ncbi:MAG: HAMP domain-containing histidine kinase [Candidatus Nomurabacteria bacterium]|jgi:two-component system phosphate regulon sensor histidine kinase PhoR|nr:HAMP domain-containing histidine kinase [Candidatus Nomurabacteria bacterium]
MDDFGGGLVVAAHELKTPLVLVRQLSLQLDETENAVARAEIIRRIRLTSEKSLRLVDNLTRAARLESAMFEMEPVILSNLCHEVVDELLPLSTVLGQEFQVKIGKSPLVAVGNRDLLRSLIMGLVDNALQYNSPGVPVEISARIRRGEAELAVRDYGATINLADFRHLRESLGTRAMPIAARPLSSGLGLLIAQKFAIAMSGRLSVERHRRGGLTFRAHLPVSQQMSLANLVDARQL